MSAPAFIDDVLPIGSDFRDGRVVKVDPQLELRVEEEGGVMFSIVRHYAHQPMRRAFCSASNKTFKLDNLT